jgi:Putative prokaryotic signal transducing protein
MDEANLIIVGSFGSEPEAEIARSALEAAGIDAMIQADTAGGMRPHIAWSGSGFKILVREEDAMAAREILEEPAQDADSEAE